MPVWVVAATQRMAQQGGEVVAAAGCRGILGRLAGAAGATHKLVENTLCIDHDSTPFATPTRKLVCRGSLTSRACSFIGAGRREPPWRNCGRLLLFGRDGRMSPGGKARTVACRGAMPGRGRAGSSSRSVRLVRCPNEAAEQTPCAAADV